MTPSKRARYDTRSQKTRDFLIGFLGWYGVNALLGGVLFGVTAVAASQISTLDASTALTQTLLALLNGVPLLCNAVLFLANLGLILYFASTRYWIALGALSAFASLLVLAICAAVIFGAVCFALLTKSGTP